MEHRIVELEPDRIVDAHEVWRRAGLHFRPDGRDSEAHLRREIDLGTTTVLGAEIDDELVAVALVTDDGRKGWINRLAVLPEHRRGGIGRELVFACERILIDRGLGLSACLVMDENDDSRALFESAGYAEAPVSYYRKPLHDTER